MKNIVAILIGLIVLTIYSCAQNQEYKGAVAELARQEAQTIDQKAEEKVENSSDRKVIKTGEISFQTTNIPATNALIAQTVKELNGYISNDNVFDYSDRQEHRLVIRVPSDKFDQLLKIICESADKLDSKNVDVMDVTEEYIDIEARIKTKKELEARYKELLKQATKVEEILNIEKEIGLLRTEIESVEGRMKYLKDRISFSTLTATYYQKTTSAFRFTSKFGEALRTGWDGFLWLLIGLTHLWTLILIGCAIGTYFLIQQKRKKGKNAS